MAMKIMHVIRPAEGGMKEHLFSLIKNMDKEQFENAVICPTNSAVTKKLKELKIEIFEVNIDGNLNPCKDINSILKIRKYINQFRPHILHTHGAKASLLGRIANIISKKSINIATVHNFVLENQAAYWKKAIYRELEKVLAKHTHSFITVSDALKGHITQNYGIPSSKIATIYNGINVSGFTNSNFEISDDLTSFKQTKYPLIGVIARLAPQKGVNYFIEAARIVCDENPEVKFVVVGDGPERKSLENLQRQLGLNNNLLFLGERKDIRAILKSINVYVLPSINEGLSISTIEAMASGCPVIATNVGGVPEIVKNNSNGILIDPANPAQMANAIIRLLKNKELASSLSTEGVRFARQQFDLALMIHKTQELYKKLSLPSSSNVI